MKKGIKVILILAAVFLLLGVALCAVSIGMGADPVEFISDGTYTISINNPVDHLFDPDTYEDQRDGSFGQRPGTFGEAVAEGENSYSVSTDIKNIEIDWVSGCVKIVKGVGDSIIFSESRDGGIDAEDRLVYEIDDNTLKISCCDDSVTIGFNIDSGCGGKELVVTVPYAIDDISVDTTSADVELDGLKIGGKLYVSTTSGGCTAVNMGCTDVELDSTSGNLTFTGECRDFNCNSVSGWVIFTGSARDLEADTTSGEVRFILNNLPEEISADTVSGEVIMYLPPEASFELEYDTVSGTFDSAFPLKMFDGAYYAGTGGAEIDVDTTSGDLSIFSF